MKLECPRCGDTFDFDPSSPGALVTCKWCQGQIRMPALSELSAEDQVEFHREVAAAQRKAEHQAERERKKAEKAARKAEGQAEAEQRSWTAAQQDVASDRQQTTPPPIPVTPQGSRSGSAPLSSSLGIGSVVLGFAGLCNICVPFVAIPLLGIGLVLGASGIVSALRNGGAGVGYAIAGTAICGILLAPAGITGLFAFELVASPVRDRIHRSRGIAEIRTAEAQIDLFDSAIQKYVFDVGDLPLTLDALVELPPHTPVGWGGPYLDSIPKDPWGMGYQYDVESRRILSLGPDGLNGTRDDIVKELRIESDG